MVLVVVVVVVVVEGVVVAVVVVITYRSLVESGSPWLGPGIIYFMRNPFVMLVPFVSIPLGQG